MSTARAGREVPSSLAEQLSDPRFFLVDFDFHDKLAVFSRARIEWFEDKLRLSAFDLPLESLCGMPLDLVMRALPEHEHPATNYLFHLPFCGSTYLTRLLEHDGVLLLRDPTAYDAVFQLGAEQREASDALDDARRIVLSCFNRRLGARTTVVRTAGYYPEMIPTLTHASTFRAGVLLYSSAEHYLLQVLKSAQRRRHVRLLMARDRAFVLEHTGEALDVLPDALVAALFWLRFVGLVLRDCIGCLRTLDCEQLFAEPEHSLARVEQLLGIASGRVSERVQQVRAVHAKTGASFSVTDRSDELERARAAYASELAAAQELLDAAGVAQMQACLEAMQIP